MNNTAAAGIFHRRLPFILRAIYSLRFHAFTYEKAAAVIRYNSSRSEATIIIVLYIVCTIEREKILGGS